jgi:hypothetical protein
MTTLNEFKQLVDAYRLGDLKGLDTAYNPNPTANGRNTDLKDPLVYTDTELEEEPLPDDLVYVTRGKGLDKKIYVGNKDREMNFLKRATLGLLDAFVDNTKVGDKVFRVDNDRQNLIPKDEYNAKRLAERRRKADISGDAVASPEQTRKHIESQRVRDAYLFEQLNKLNDYELERWKNAYPQYAKMINDEIFKRRMQIEYNSPSELQNRLTAGFDTRNAAKVADAEAYLKIAQGMKTGLERFV